MEFTSVHLGDHFDSTDHHDNTTLAASGGKTPSQHHPSTSPTPHTLTTTQASSQIFSAISNSTVSLSAVESLILADPHCVGVVDLENGYTPLHFAARRGHCGLIKLLVEHGGDVEARGNLGETPLLLACQNGSLYAVHTLAEHGADLKAVDESGGGAVHLAAKIGAAHVLHYLSSVHGVDLRTTDNEGNTALHYAVLNQNLDTVAYLLRKKRCNVTAANNTKSTPLHLAVKLGASKVAWMILNSTRKRLPKILSARDCNKNTPRALALRGTSRSHKVLAGKLEAWEVSPNYMKIIPWSCWGLCALLPCLALLLALYFFSHVNQPIGFVLALFCTVPGFFLPITLHRIPHDAGWENPTMMGALVLGVAHTTLCYLFAIFPRLWPDNVLMFTILVINSLFATYLFFKFKLTDPSFDKVGKISSDGKPLTILDVARQGCQSDDEDITEDHEDDCDHCEKKKKKKEMTHGSPDKLVFCVNCEIVIPERTKHCKLCEGCCNGFDHHCMWLTKCVGYNNHRLFVLFTFVVGFDNILFIWEGFSCIAKVTGTNNIWQLLVAGFTAEHWIMLIMICNTITMVFCFLNFANQLSNVSKLETTFFDMAGRAAYNTRREHQKLSLLTRLRLIQLFFMDYPRWYRRSIPVQSYDSACYPRVNPV